MKEKVRFDPSDNLLEGVAQRRHFPLGCLVSAQANTEPSELEWGHSRVQTPGEGFSSNSTPDFSDNTGLLWASPPSVGFNSNKGLLAMGASLSGQIMLSDFPACLASTWRIFSSGSASGVHQIKVDLNL